MISDTKRVFLLRFFHFSNFYLFINILKKKLLYFENELETQYLHV